MEEASTCVASICDGQDLVQHGLDAPLLLSVVSFVHPRRLETELQREPNPRPESRIQPVISNDRAPPLLFFDETLCNLPPPRFA